MRLPGSGAADLFLRRSHGWATLVPDCRTDSVQSAVGVNVAELSEAVLRITRLAQATWHPSVCPFGVDGIGVGDVQIHHRTRSFRVVVAPFVQMQGHRVSVGESVVGVTFMSVRRKAQVLVAVESGIKVANWDHRCDTLEHRPTVASPAPVGQSALCQG
jgi:hypothetical protein